MVFNRINHLLYVLLLIAMLGSCTMDDPDAERAEVTITNSTLETLKFDNGDYFLGIKTYQHVYKGATSVLTFICSRSVTAYGDASGLNYGTKSFRNEGTYSWHVSKKSFPFVKVTNLSLEKLKIDNGKRNDFGIKEFVYVDVEKTSSYIAAPNGLRASGDVSGRNYGTWDYSSFEGNFTWTISLPRD